MYNKSRHCSTVLIIDRLPGRASLYLLPNYLSYEQRRKILAPKQIFLKKHLILNNVSLKSTHNNG